MESAFAGAGAGLTDTESVSSWRLSVVLTVVVVVDGDEAGDREVQNPPMV